MKGRTVYTGLRKAINNLHHDEHGTGVVKGVIGLVKGTSEATNTLGDLVAHPVNCYIIPAAVAVSIAYMGVQLSDVVENKLFTHISEITRNVGTLGYSLSDIVLGTGIKVVGGIEALLIGRELYVEANGIQKESFVARTSKRLKDMKESIGKKYIDFKKKRGKSAQSAFTLAEAARTFAWNTLTNTYVLCAVTLGTFIDLSIPEFNTIISDAYFGEKIVSLSKLGLFLGLGGLVTKKLYYSCNGSQQDALSERIPIISELSKKVRNGHRTLAKLSAAFLTVAPTAPPFAQYVVDTLPDSITIPRFNKGGLVTTEPSTPATADYSELTQKHPILVEIARTHGLDPHFFVAQGYTETQLRHHDKNGRVIQSHRGAIGIYQIMPIGLEDVNISGRTPRGTKPHYTWQEIREDDKANATVGVLYNLLSRKRGQTVLPERYRYSVGSLQELAFLASAYNTGFENTRRAMQKADSGDFNDYARFLPRQETRDYVRIILGQMQAYQQFQFPTKSRRITDVFGSRNGRHRGVDIGALTVGVEGDQITAALPGEVIRAERHPLNGNWVQIRTHVEGLNDTYIITNYLHGVNNSFKVRAGDTVETGDPILAMGNTGRSRGIHLHFEAYITHGSKRQLRYIDPLIIPENSRKSSDDYKETIAADNIQISPFAFIKSMAKSFIPEKLPDHMDEALRQEYKTALIFKQQEEYAKAIEAFKGIAKKYPRHSINDDVYMHLGDCYLGLADFTKDAGINFTFEARRAYQTGLRFHGDMTPAIQERLSAL